jgi:hypothetical protein
MRLLALHNYRNKLVVTAPIAEIMHGVAVLNVGCNCAARLLTPLTYLDAKEAVFKGQRT